MKSSERTKEKIADAFCELASGKPISRISVREIAQKSGVTTVSFYHYFDKNVRYRGSLQNYLIDTGSEVILVDTGIPAGTPEEAPDKNSLLFTGKDICSYMDAFAALGYKPEQVTKILLTHKHGDHSGELRSFPNAKIYVNEEECSADELQGLSNIVPVKFTDGPYHNFPESQKIADGVYFIKAKGHTKGNSLVVAENDGLFYMFQADITYVDDKASISF